MPADLDDDHGVGGLDARPHDRVVQRAGHDGQNVVARGKRATEGGRTRHHRGDARHHLGGIAIGQPLEQIHEGPVEERIALAQHGDIAAGIEMHGKLQGSLVVDILRRKALDAHGHHDRHLDLAVAQIRRDDAAGEALAAVRRGIGDHGC
ncbi:hypothetical protein D3C87_1637390 [compost metagenome]